MPEKKPELDFTNNYYLVIPRSNLKEFVSLLEVILNQSKKKKVIPEETINRFYSLMKPLRSTPKVAASEYNDIDRIISAFEVIEFIREQRNSSQYVFKREWAFIPFLSLDAKTKLMKKGNRKVFRWYDGFETMIYTIVNQLVLVKSLNKNEWLDKDFCIKEAYLLFVKYKSGNMSLEQQLKYSKPYKFIALSAIIAHKVFGFHISSQKELTIWEYHQYALNALKKYNVR